MCVFSSAVISTLPKSPGEDLILDLSVPESVEVIYKSSDSAPDKHVCTVTEHTHTLECGAEYTPRVSLSYPKLTLTGIQRGESGTYIIRGRENKEDIRVYTVSVTGESQC